MKNGAPFHEQFAACISVTFVCLLAATSPMDAQIRDSSHHSLAVYAGLFGVKTAYPCIGIVWNVSDNSAWDVSFSYKPLHARPDPAFNGERVNYFTKRRSYTYSWLSRDTFNDSGWYYLGSNRPLPDLEKNKIALNAGQAKIGWKNIVRFGNKRWTFISEPQLQWNTLLVSEVLEDDVYKYRKTHDSFYSAQPGIYQSEDALTEYFRQFQKMKISRHFSGGFAYGLGLGCQTNNGIWMELSLVGGLNIGSMPATQNDIPEYMRHYFAYVNLVAGYTFGH